MIAIRVFMELSPKCKSLVFHKPQLSDDLYPTGLLWKALSETSTAKRRLAAKRE